MAAPLVSETGYAPELRRGTYTETQYTTRNMRCLGIMEHELTSVRRWGKELGFLTTTAVGCAGFAADRFFAMQDGHAGAAAWMWALVAAAIVFGFLAYRKKTDIDDLAEIILRDSTDIRGAMVGAEE